MGICHRSCGTNGCWKGFDEAGDTLCASGPLDGETGKFDVGVFISFSQDRGFEGENADGYSPKSY